MINKKHKLGHRNANDCLQCAFFIDQNKTIFTHSNYKVHHIQTPLKM